MKKRITACAVLLAATALCTACTRQSVETGHIESTPAPVESTLAPVEPGQSWTIAEENISLDAETQSYKLLRYPCLSGEDETVIALNRALVAAAERVYSVHATNVQAILDDGETFTYEVTEVEVTRFDETILSVRCFAACTAANSTQRFVYTCNLNPATAAEYLVTELVSDFAGLGKLLRAGKGVQLWGTSNLLELTTWDDLLGEIKPTYGIYPPICFTSAGIVLCFETNMLLDDHAGFLIPYADADDCLVVGAPQD